MNSLIIALSCAASADNYSLFAPTHSKDNHIVFDDEEDQTGEEDTGANGKDVKCQVRGGSRVGRQSEYTQNEI
jgi:hypothetical protein